MRGRLIALIVALFTTVAGAVAATATAAIGTSSPPPPPRAHAASPPQVALLDVDAIRKEMVKSRGRVLLVHLWATWCEPCLSELPLVDRMARELRENGAAEVLSISLDRETQAPRVARLLAEKAPHLTPMIAQVGDPRRFIAAFTPEWNGAIPALFAFDRQGTLRRGLIGELNQTNLGQLASEVQRWQERPAPLAQPGQATTHR
jgi:thiol-disulfide isomerase/thioredoxin